MKKKLYWKESTKLVKLTVSHDSSSCRLTSLEIFRPTGQILHVKGKAILKTVKDYSHVNNPFGICYVKTSNIFVFDSNQKTVLCSLQKFIQDGK